MEHYFLYYYTFQFQCATQGLTERWFSGELNGHSNR